MIFCWFSWSRRAEENPWISLPMVAAPFANVICKRGTVRGLIRDLTTGGTVGAAGKTGLLAHSAADVNCVINRALDELSALGPDEVRNTLRSLDLIPETFKASMCIWCITQASVSDAGHSGFTSHLVIVASRLDAAPGVGRAQLCLEVVACPQCLSHCPSGRKTCSAREDGDERIFLWHRRTHNGRSSEPIAPLEGPYRCLWGLDWPLFVTKGKQI